MKQVFEVERIQALRFVRKVSNILYESFLMSKTPYTLSNCMYMHAVGLLFSKA